MDLFSEFYSHQRRMVTYPGIKKDTYIVTENGLVFEIVKEPFIYAKLAKTFINTYGYLQVKLIDENGNPISPMLSRIVAWEFVLLNRDFRLKVDHYDSNKLNNHYSNLEWVTNLENLRRAYKNHLNKSIASYKTDEEIHKVCYLLSTTDWPYEKVCAEAGLNLNVNQAKGLCSDILSGNYWRHISYNYDFSQRLLNRRVFITPEQKDIMFRMCQEGYSYIDIYHWLYNKEPTKKAMESFKKVMSRVIQRGSSTIPNGSSV